MLCFLIDAEHWVLGIILIKYLNGISIEKRPKYDIVEIYVSGFLFVGNSFRFIDSLTLNSPRHAVLY